VSSTFTDLQAHRAAVVSAADSVSTEARGMEIFGARPGAPREECLSEVRKAHIFVLILGMRYGSVDLESGLAFTHLEYLEAQRMSIPCLVYLIDESAHLILPKHADVGDGGVKLRDFKATVQRVHTVSFFSSAEDLQAKSAGDLAALLRSERFGDDPAVLSSVVAELPKAKWLNSDRFEFLRGKMGQLAERAGHPSVLKEVLEFLLVGDRQSATFLLVKKSALGMREAIDLCMGIENVLREVVEFGLARLAEDKPGGPAANMPNNGNSGGT
jgi:hypothetical protein